MGTLLLLVFRFVLGLDATVASDYQVLCLTASLDSIAFLVLLTVLKRRSA